MTGKEELGIQILSPRVAEVTSPSSAALLFSSIFLIAFLLQGIRWKEFDMIDSGMWGHQAQYVVQGDSREFDFRLAYGHPGGPVIEGTILLNRLFHIRYDIGVLVFVTIFNSLVIASIGLTLVALRKETAWLVASVGVLSLNRLYASATPPSAVVAPLIVLLCVLTLYLSTHTERIRPALFLLWGVVSGLAIAARADIGGLCSAVFFLYLLVGIEQRRLLYLSFVAAASTFVLADPFMWFMPLQHIGDIVHKIFYLYTDIGPNYLSAAAVVTFSSLASISMALSILLLFLHKKYEPVLPPRFISMLIGMTIVLYTVFLTSPYQAVRYFMPVIFIWEVFLPLFLVGLTDLLPYSGVKNKEALPRSRRIPLWSLVALILVYHVSSFCIELYVAQTYHLLSYL